MSRILFVTEYFFNGHGPRIIRTSNIIKHTKKYTPEVLCLDIEENKNSFDGVTHKVSLNYWHHQKLAPPPSLFWKICTKLVLKLLDLILFPDLRVLEVRKLATKIQRLDQQHNYSAIVLSVVPFSLMKVLKYLTPTLRAKIILDIGDPFYKNVVQQKNLYSDSYRRHFEGQYLRLAKRIIVTNDAIKDHYIQEYDLLPEMISVISQGYDPELFSPQPQKPPSANTLSLCYAGTFYKTLRDYEPLVTAFRTLNSDQERVTLNVYGGHIPNPPATIKVLQRLPQMELVPKLCDSDIIVFIDNAFGMQVSGKIYELLALEKPLLFLYSNEMSVLLQQMKKSGEPIIFCLNNSDEIVSTLINLMKLKLLPVPHFHHTPYSWESQATSVEAIISHIDTQSLGTPTHG